MADRTYRYTGCNILYPFGYGLSYSDVCYTGQSVSLAECSVTDSVTVKAEVTNNGKFQVNESVQVYIKHNGAETYEPGYQLKGIKNILLMPGETKEAEITLSARDFAIITEKGECVVRPGSYIISIGGQQPDKRSEELSGKKTALFTIERTGSEEKIEY